MIWSSTANSPNANKPSRPTIEPTQELDLRSTSIWNDALPPTCDFSPDLMSSLYATDDSAVYSSEGSYSPISECPQPYTRPQRSLPQYQDAQIRSTSHLLDVPASAYSVSHPRSPNVSHWSGYDVTSQPTSGLGFGFESPFPAPVVGPQFICTAHEPPIDNVTDTLSSTFIPSLDRNGRDNVPRECGDTTGMAAAQVASGNGMVKLDNESVQHYYDCYWKNFHTTCPIVHYPTLLSTRPPPLLTAIIIAIGAQFSSRSSSKTHSTSMFGLSSRLLPAVSVFPCPMR